MELPPYRGELPNPMKVIAPACDPEKVLPMTQRSFLF